MGVARCLAMSLAMLATAGGARAGTWTVDDDGPADFSSITAAIASVPAGDTLLVAPGVYQPFTLEKRLEILGVSGGEMPLVMGQSRVQNTSTATLAGLRLESLWLDHVSGLLRIDECRVAMHSDTNPNGGSAALVAFVCSQLLVTRCFIDGNAPSDFGISYGVALNGCAASFTSCTLRGSNHAASPPGECGIDGFPAAFVSGGSVRFTACTLLGGEGGYSGCFSLPSDGWGASGIQSWQAFVDVRGGTLVKAGDFDQGYGGQYAAFDAHGGTAVLGGGTIGSGGLKLSAGTQLITAVPDEPTLRVVPDSEHLPDGSGTVFLTAPPTLPCILFVSPGAGLTHLAAIDGSLWLSLPVPVILPLAAGTTAVPYALPGSSLLAGAQITLQAVFPTMPGAVQPTKAAITAPDQIVVRF